MLFILASLSIVRAQKEFIPPIASVLGIRVGHNGRGRLERVLGKGRYSVGGHPNGTETWRLIHPSSTVDVEGFSYTAHEGEVIEQLTWSAHVSFALRPSRYRRTPTGWLGSIVPGMPQAEVLRSATHLLGSPQRKGGVYSWTQKGSSAPAFLNGGDPFTSWTADLTFTGEKLVEIDISCK